MSSEIYFINENDFDLDIDFEWESFFALNKIECQNLRGIVFAYLNDDDKAVDTDSIFRKLLFYRSLLRYVLEQGSTSRQYPNIFGLTQMGGDYGRDNPASAQAIYGGYFSGIFKCLSIEHNHCNFKAIDLDPLTDIKTNIDNIINEIKYQGRLEVGYKGADRYVFNIREEPFTLNYKKPFQATDAVILVFGGARGITSECLKQIINERCNLILVGRSFDIDYSSDLDKHKTHEELKKALIIKTKGDTRITPAELNKKCNSIMRQREIKANIRELASSQCQVEYIEADTTRVTEIRDVIKNVYERFGKIDGIIHAAGVLKDKLFLDQNVEGFELVYKTKVTILEALMKYVDIQNLSLLIFFSSVAGRFGNAGQSDYAAANETISRFACYAKHLNNNLCVCSIHWGPWDTTGMANESVKERFKKQGIIPIPIEAGALTFEKAFFGGFNNVELIAGEGPWVGYETHSTESDNDTVVTNISPLPFITSEIINEPTGAISYTFELNRYKHLFLLDHQIDSNLVLPATAALELMAEVVQCGWPDWIVTEVRSLRVLKGIFIEKDIDSKILRVKAIPSTHADASEVSVSVSIEDKDTKQAYYRAIVIMRNDFQTVDDEYLDTKDLPYNVTSSELYENVLFHGPLFRLIEKSTNPSETSISALVKGSNIDQWFNENSKGRTWTFDPGLLDTGPQLAIVWSRKVHNTTPLPNYFDSIIRYRKPQSSDIYKAILNVKSFTETNITYDVFYQDSKGDVIIKMTGCQGTCNAALNRLSSQ